MKKTIILIVFFLLGAFAFSQQKVALHHNGTTTIYSGTNPLIDAYTAAVSNDTIYLPGGTFAPPTNFDKTLVLFGAGHYESATLATGKTFISGDVVLKENADNFFIEGIEIGGSLTFSNNESVDQVVIKRCKINGALRVLGNLSASSTNLGIIGAVILGDIYLDNAQGVLISNSIIQERVFNSISNVLNNNIFLHTYGSSTYTINGDNNTVNNNIFVRTSSYANYLIGGNGNVVKNNVILNTSPIYGTLPTVSGNYLGIAQETIFVNQSGNSFDYLHDYHLQDTASYLGIDGLQVGIYGGVFPYKENAIPTNPHIDTKTIAPQTNTSGELNIQVVVKAQTN